MKQHNVVIKLDQQAYEILTCLFNQAKNAGYLDGRSGPATVLQEAAMHMLRVVNAPNNPLIKGLAH